MFLLNNQLKNNKCLFCTLAWHLLSQLLTKFNKTKAAKFPILLCFLRTSILSLSILTYQPIEKCINVKNWILCVFFKALNVLA